MARIDSLSKRGPMTGNSRSKALNITRRRWHLNLQKFTVLVKGQPVRMRISVKTKRTLMKKNLLV